MRRAGRTTVWITCGAGDAGAKGFLERSGFRYASHDARRRQIFAEIDRDTIDALLEQAQEAARDYELVRLTPPISDELLAELVKVTAAINDAPMGELNFEDEKFDLQRLKDLETARVGRGDEMYRVVARHRQTGEVGGHTFMLTNPLRPTYAEQGDTAVSREHRGHRLGLLLKIDMMRWLAESEPQLEIIETWNRADNTFMVRVNEELGYRLSKVFDTYQLVLD